MNENKKKKGFLGTVERVGNALPHPAIIFLLLCVIIAVVSHICAKLGVSVTYTGLDRSTNEIKEIIKNTPKSKMSEETFLTKLDNAQLLCKSHNTSKGNRI